MRASLTELVGGEDVTLALPIGALEDLALHEPKLIALHRRLIEGMSDGLKLDARDVFATLRAAAGREAAERVVDVLGVVGAAAVAARILTLALADDTPEDERPKG